MCALVAGGCNITVGVLQMASKRPVAALEPEPTVAGELRALRTHIYITVWNTLMTVPVTVVTLLLQTLPVISSKRIRNPRKTHLSPNYR